MGIYVSVKVVFVMALQDVKDDALGVGVAYFSRYLTRFLTSFLFSLLFYFRTKI
jgi:hypothetical protein